MNCVSAQTVGLTGLGWNLSSIRTADEPSPKALSWYVSVEDGARSSRCDLLQLQSVSEKGLPGVPTMES